MSGTLPTRIVSIAHKIGEGNKTETVSSLQIESQERMAHGAAQETQAKDGKDIVQRLPIFEGVSCSYTYLIESYKRQYKLLMLPFLVRPKHRGPRGDAIPAGRRSGRAKPP